MRNDRNGRGGISRVGFAAAALIVLLALTVVPACAQLFIGDTTPIRGDYTSDDGSIIYVAAEKTLYLNNASIIADSDNDKGISYNEGEIEKNCTERQQ